MPEEEVTKLLGMKATGVVAAVFLLVGCATTGPTPQPVETTKAPVETPVPEPVPTPELITSDNFYDICVAQLTAHDYVRDEAPVRTIAAESDSLIVQRADGMVVMAAHGTNENGDTTLICGAKGYVDDPEWHQFGASLRMTDAEIQERIDLIGNESA